MLEHRQNLVLYTSAICNLNCEYCYIDKNPALKKIDNILDESFKDDYYFNFTKEMFPDPFQLKKIEFWGGEPSIGLNRTHNTIKSLIEYYPHLKIFMMSTNFTLDDFIDNFNAFLQVLASYPTRKFEFHLQLSIDGPKHLNDKSRGLGTTEKFFNNYIKLLNLSIPKNVTLISFFKPTLSNNSIRLLQTKQAVIEYYKFFDELITIAKIKQNNTSNYLTRISIPNTAVPSPHTTEDGKLFANFCKICNEIENDGLNKYFNFYTDTIMPFKGSLNKKNISYKNCGACGSGYCVLGLLPDRMVSTCHNGFVDLISDYKLACESKQFMNIENVLEQGFFEVRNSRTALTVEKYKDFESYMLNLYNQNSTAKNGNCVNIIQTLAYSGQIDKKYQNIKNALYAAEFINNNFAYCIRDNINSTGCLELPPLGAFRLLLNGALEEIVKDELE